MKIIIWLTMFTVMTLNTAFATSAVRPGVIDQRIKHVVYNPNDVVPLHGTMLVTTQVQFAHDETITDVQCGDAVGWSINVNKDAPYLLNIKPMLAKSHTDLMVLTQTKTGEHRKYYFSLLSSADSSLPITYAIIFSYPAIHYLPKIVHIAAAKAPEHYNWDYAFAGDKTLVPLHVYDDGRFTYMQFRSRSKLPAIFAIDNKQGREAVVNYRTNGNTVVILQTSPQFSLRQGVLHVASIFNNMLIAKRWK